MKDLCANPNVSRVQARYLSVTERSELGPTLRWKDAVPVPGKVSGDLSASVRFQTWRALRDAA